MRYELHPGDSEVRVVAHAPLHASKARSRGVTGSFAASLEDGVVTGAVSGFAEVRLDTFKSGNRLLEANTLRHIEARRFPVARFEIAAVETTQDREDGRVRVGGTLDFHGCQVDVAALARVEETTAGLRISGSWQLVQSDFGLRPPRLVMLKVADAIDVDFDLVATTVAG